VRNPATLPTILPTLRRAAALGRVRHYPMLLYLATLSVLRRRSQVVRQRSAKPPFVGSIPTGAFRDSPRHLALHPPHGQQIVDPQLKPLPVSY
jgi:hypothetical protein